MRKIASIFLFTTILILVNAKPLLAISPTPDDTSEEDSPSASVSAEEEAIGKKLNKQINQLKERIASRVAELNLVEKRGIIGTVTETSGNQITFTDLNGKTRFIDVDEITKFSSPSAKSSFGLSDLTKGTKISILGLYNKQSQRILARFIDSYAIPTFLSGRIADLDKTNFTVTIITEDKKETTIDIETITNITTHTKEDGIAKLGFSKLTIGDRVVVTGFPDKTDPALLSATRILVLPELPKNPKIIVPEPTTEATSPTISTTSGAKKSPTPTQ